MTPEEARAILLILDLIDNAKCTSDVALLKSAITRVVHTCLTK